MTVLVTGAAGFIGSNFIKLLNNQGITDICACDYLTDGRQFKNLQDLKWSSFITPDKVVQPLLKHISRVFHFGAVSNTTEWNGELVLARNYNYTVELITTCATLGIPVSYSSSASVYGNGSGPLNLYAWSKWLVDEWVQDKVLGKVESPVQGFRYFNVYGPGEWHKDSQASPHTQFREQALQSGVIKVFEGSRGYIRDFVSVDAVCSIQLKVSGVEESGIWDLGSGVQRSFMDVAEEVAAETGARIIEIPFPENLKDTYQWSTKSDMEPLNAVLAKHGLTV